MPHIRFWSVWALFTNMNQLRFALGAFTPNKNLLLFHFLCNVQRPLLMMILDYNGSTQNWGKCNFLSWICALVLLNWDTAAVLCACYYEIQLSCIMGNVGLSIFGAWWYDWKSGYLCCFDFSVSPASFSLVESQWFTQEYLCKST